MGIEQRKHERYQVRLAVHYASAADFVLDYIENLSLGGLFIAGTRKFELLKEEEVLIELPGQGSWRVRAKPVFILSAEAASRTGKNPGAGMQITAKPPGFDDALFGYLLRLGRRREVTVMVGDVPGAHQVASAGYQVVPLAGLEAIVDTIATHAPRIIAVVVPPASLVAYSDTVRRTSGEIVFQISASGQAADVVARIDSLL